MKTIRKLTLLVASLVSLSASAFELDKWKGVWERYSASGQVEERITANEVIKGKLLSSKIEYFKEGNPLGDGATVMSDLNGKVRASMHFTNGMAIELETLERNDESVFFLLKRIDLSSGESTDMFTRFTLMEVENKVVLRQDLYQDKEQQTQLVSVDFYKQSA